MSVSGVVDGFFVQEAVPGLHDIVVPEPVSWMPGTVGWGAAFVVFAALSVVALVRLHRRRVANRYRVAALRELADIEGALDSPERRTEALATLPVLVKRVALTFADRHRVASLTGDPWLAFLDETYGGTGFTHGPGSLLPQLAFEPSRSVEAVDGGTAQDLVLLVREWIGAHDARKVSGEPRDA